MPLLLFCTMVQQSQKWPKTQIKGGPALKLEEKSCFNFMKTRFDWERLDFAKYRKLLFVRSNFCSFLCDGEQGGYSSHLLQSRILKNVLEPELPPI